MTRKIITCTLLFTFSFVANTQIDSLWNNYLKETDEVKARALFMKIQGKCKKNIGCYEPITAFLKDASFNEVTPRTFSFICSAFQSSFLFQDCITYGILALRMFNKHTTDDKWPFLICNSLSLSYGHVSKVDSALYYASESEKYVNNPELIKYAWRPDYARFNAYEVIKKKDLAFSYLEKSYSFLIHSEDRMNKGFILYELLRMSDIRQKSSAFEKYLKDYIEFSKQGNKKTDDIHANLFVLFKEDNEAIKILEEKLKKIEADTGASLQVNPITEKMNLIRLYTRQGKNKNAIQRLHEISKDSSATGDGVLNNTYLALIENYEALGQYDSAFIYAKKYNAFLDNRYQNNLADKIAEFEIKYQTSLKDKEMQTQRAIISKNKLELRISYILLACSCGLAALLFLFFHSRSKQRNAIMAQSRELQEQRIKQLENAHKLLALNSLIEGQEQERLRVAQDLHDGLGGLLTTVKAHINALAYDSDTITTKNNYKKTNQLIDEACSEVRRIAHNMVPHSIKITGLTGALEDLKESIVDRGLICELDVHGFINHMLSDQKSNMLFRILQELTTNVTRHAQATKVLIQLLAHENELRILVSDNGKGFDVNQTETRGMGLKSIQSRTEYLGGTMMIDSSPSHGTIIHLEIPLTTNDAKVQPERME